METQQLAHEIQHDIRPSHVFGGPIRADGVTLLPAIYVRSEGSGRNARGAGTRVRPVGVYVLRDGLVSWRPAVDVNRIIWGAQVIALVLAVGSALSRRASRPRRAARSRGMKALLGGMMLGRMFSRRRKASGRRWLS